MNIHNFYAECRDKFGFGDGDNQPDGAYAVRDRLVKEINQRLEKRNSPIRCAAYNRPGRHNSCMILWPDDPGVGKNPDEIWEILDEINEVIELDFSIKIFEIDHD